MSADWLKPAIQAVAETLIAHSEELSDLDSAIGDGDHGHNMKRGFQAVLEQIDQIAAEEPPKALQKIGMTLVGKVGGASGPLYGTLFMQAGKSWDGTPSVAAVAAAVEGGLDGVKARGKATAGEKTMIDVWEPVVAALKEASDKSGADAAAAARSAAETGLEATREMKATKGRAAYLGERSIGHLDPGARSSELIVQTLSDLVSKGVAP
ncbi:dihydroxyacetone kinase subunit DhaL [Amorphus orientalis]|uniref:Dihydroxyacetone kinase-like protein n=1 Tax=Amorphus orientalis TaxID=649198 RepID=A0AAE4ATW2_9HYPH|nr:dihydroxyacetone kinase subunit DhaL [Amorphus orientalis]MDQ0315344.1 dihydroxyacetone kinase-like protein [Amorphus orientalis]